MDVISFGPDGEPRRWPPRLRWPGWRGRAWLVILAAVAVSVAVAGLVLVSTRGAGQRPAGAPPAGAMPGLLSGVPARSVPTSLIIGGDYLWRLGAGEPRPVLGGWLSDGLSPLLRGVAGAGISQIVAVQGGVVALMTSASPPINGTAGPVLFIPEGAATARIIGRASVIVVAPGGRSVWLQTAVQRFSGPPPGTARPVLSPTFAVTLAGRRLGPVLRLPLGLTAATGSGLLTASVATGQLRLWNPATGRAERLRLPSGAQVVGESSGLVIWQPQSCPAHCPLHLTDLRAGSAITVEVPAGWWPVPYQEPVASDASGHRLVLPLDRVDSSGNPTAEALYVIDPAARAARQVPGGPSASSQPLGLGTPGVQLAGAWDQHGRLWVLASSRYGYFQLGYWTGAGPLHVYPPIQGNPAAISAPGPG